MNLRLENLQRAYPVPGGAKTVLDIGEGRIAHGRVTGVIGPNGAGKSTLLNILAGIDRPSAGRVLYGAAAPGGKEAEAAGEDAGYTATAPRGRVTLLFQQPYLIRTTVEKNIAYPLKLRRWPKAKAKARVDGLMAALGLAPLARQRGWRLSGGEAQKVALARALSFGPDLLLMDEPTSSIDHAATADIEALLRKTNREDGLTIVMVSHNLAQIRRLCDDVFFMNKGRLVESGPAADLLARPQQAETRAFVAGELLV